MVGYQSNMSVEEQFTSTVRAVFAAGDSPIPSRREQLSRLDQLTMILENTVYRETLMKRKFDEFDESWPNRQTKTTQYEATIYF